MLMVTDSAKKELKKILSEKADNPLAALRLVRGGQPDDYGLAIDIEMPHDQVVEHEGSKVLVLDRELSNHLDGNILDVEDAPHGKSFVVLAKK